MYEVDFPDGSTEAFTENLVAEIIYSQVNEEGKSYSILSDILDHIKNGHALSKDDAWVTGCRGKKHPRKTTWGWESQVEWRDGLASWVTLKYLK